MKDNDGMIQGKTHVQEEKAVPEQLYTLKVSHGLTWDSVVQSR
jgi:hypothetical protein